MKRVGVSVLLLVISGISFLIFKNLCYRVYDLLSVPDGRLTPFEHRRESYERPRLRDVVKSAFPPLEQPSTNIPRANWFAMLHFDWGALPDLSSPPRIPGVSLVSLEFTWAPIVYVDAGERIYRMWLTGIRSSETVERAVSIYFANRQIHRLEMPPSERDTYDRANTESKTLTFYSDRWKEGRFQPISSTGKVVERIPWEQLVWMRVSPASRPDTEPAISWVYPGDIREVVHYKVRLNANQQVQEVVIGFARSHSQLYQVGVCVQDRTILMSLREGELMQRWGMRFEMSLPVESNNTLNKKVGN